MRIITGKFKGRALKMPKGIRPTQDKVRKAIFDILMDVEGLTFLELFAGSGAVGLEAVSRGAKGLVLVESDRNCQLVIKENMEHLKTDNVIVYPQEVSRALEHLNKVQKKFDIIFLDPPYHKEKIPSPGDSSSEENASTLSKKTLQLLGCCDILAPNGFVIVEHFKRDPLPEDIAGFALIKRASYGDTFLSFYVVGKELKSSPAI